MKEAAAIAGVSLSTLRRKKADLITGGAEISDEGWKVPYVALRYAGLIKDEGPGRDGRSRKDAESASQGPEASGATTVRGSQIDAQGLTELYEWKTRALVAEAVLPEKNERIAELRSEVEAARMMQRMLAGSLQEVQKAPETAQENVDEESSSDQLREAQEAVQRLEREKSDLEQRLRGVHSVRLKLEERATEAEELAADRLQKIQRLQQELEGAQGLIEEAEQARQQAEDQAEQLRQRKGWRGLFSG